MLNKPTRNQQRHRQQNRTNRQPIPPRPPQRQQKASPKHQTRNLASDDIKSAEYEKCADQGGAEIAGRESKGGNAARHMGYAALARVEGDGLYVAAGQDGGYCVAEFVEGYYKHLGFS